MVSSSDGLPSLHDQISSLSPPPHDILDSTSNSEYMVSRIEGQVEPSYSQDIRQEMLQVQLHVLFTLEA
jgi:hypothetical protein